MKKNFFFKTNLGLDFLKIFGWVLGVLLLIAPFQAHAAWDPNQALPVSVRILLREVREAMNQKDFQGGIQKITAFYAGEKSVSTHDPEAASCRHPMVCFALGTCYLLKADYPNAQTAFLQALEKAPNFTDAWVNLAKAYNETGQYREAADCFLNAYNGSDPKVPGYLYYSAVTCLMGHQHVQAIALFEKLFESHPGSIVRQWRENYANALLAAGRMKQAVPVIRQLAAETSGEEKIRWQESLLQVYLQMNDTGQALTYAVELTRTNCSVAKWWKARVHIHLSLGQYNCALEDLMIYGYLTPLSEEEKNLWADLCLQLGIPDKAAQVYETLLSQKSNNKTRKQMLQRLVSAYRQLDMPEKALALMGRFDPGDGDPELLMLKGDLLYAVKRFDDANTAFRTAARKKFDQAGQAWLMAGYASWQQNDLKASIEAFEHAAQFNRHRKDAMAAMAQLKRTNQM